jgi:hypothetical protein
MLEELQVPKTQHQRVFPSKAPGEKKKVQNTLNMGAKPTPDQWQLSFYSSLLFSMYNWKSCVSCNSAYGYCTNLNTPEVLTLTQVPTLSL